MFDSAMPARETTIAMLEARKRALQEAARNGDVPPEVLARMVDSYETMIANIRK